MIYKYCMKYKCKDCPIKYDCKEDTPRSFKVEEWTAEEEEEIRHKLLMLWIGDNQHFEVKE